MFLSLGRAIKFSLEDIFRNIWLSLVTIIILVLALFSVNMLLVVKVIGQAAIDAVKEKIDVNLFLKNNAEESEILALKSKIAAFNEVKEIKYISKEEAMDSFITNHKDDPEILAALKELGKNPLAPTLVIKPVSLDALDNLTNRLSMIDENIIESRNFTNYKTLLTKINQITKKVSDAGLVLSAIFVFITILVVFNSIRVAIYTHRREIMIMRLVGASRWFIQMPYLLSGVFYTVIGLASIMVIFYFFLSLLQPYLEAFFVGYNVDLLNYFYGNIFTIFGAQFLGVALINILASLLAVRKYSQV